MLARIVPDIQKTAELVQVIQQNASATEQIASTAEELSSQAVQNEEGMKASNDR